MSENSLEKRNKDLLKWCEPSQVRGCLRSVANHWQLRLKSYFGLQATVRFYTHTFH